MHLESRCYSSSAINKQTNSPAEGSGHAAATASASVNRTWLRSAKKDKTVSGAGIFSFLQKFRVVGSKNEVNAVADSSFSLASPQSSRYSLASAGVGAGRRWESIESVISSATATSFAFIPPHQLRQFNYPRPPSRAAAFERDQRAGRGPNNLGNRYRLAVDENRSPNSALVDSKDAANVKRLNRNSTGNIENFWIPPNNSGCTAAGASAAPTSSKDSLVIPNKRKRCYRPGKRKAPQPPRTSTVHNKINEDSKIINGNSRLRGSRTEEYEYEDDDDDENSENNETRVISPSAKKPLISGSKKKKRQAPLPPIKMDDKATSNESATAQAQPMFNDLLESDPNDDQPLTYCNDSLKLEKGILKANKHSVEINVKNDSSKLASPTSPQPAAVSPKPWYKRSCVKAANTHNNASGLREKRNSCRKDEMDQWMLESGIARFRRIDEDIFKRHSHISVLANISELDRQACEILEKQRKQQRDAINSAEAKFYSDLMENDQPVGKEQFIFNDSASPSTKKNKDLISILNNLTSVTKMTVHSAFVSKTASRESNDDENITLASGSGTSSVHKLAERSRQQSSNLLPNKNKKTSKIGEMFEKSHRRDIKKKDDKRLTNKSYLSFDTANDIKTSSKEKSTLIGNITTTPIQTKINAEPVNTNSNDDEISKHQITRPVQKPFSSWSCPQCNSENPSWKFICEVCKKWRPYSVSSRTTDQRYFVSTEKDTSKESTENDTGKQQETRSLQLMHLNVKNNTASNQTNQKSDNMIKSSESHNERYFQRREFYSSIAAAAVDTEKVDKPSFVTRSPPKNNLNGTQQMKSQVNQTLQYYNDQDRKMLCDILKELRNSLSSSRRGRLSIEADAANEQKIINKVDSTVSKLSTNSNDMIVNTYTSPPNDFKTTETRAAASSSKNTKNTNPNRLEPNSTNSGSEKLCNVKHEANDEVDDNETAQAERKQPNETKLTAENKTVPVLAINRLLKKLQTAIANGQHHEAANIARELARLKVSCHMTRRSNFDVGGPSNVKTLNSSSTTGSSLDTFVISVYIKEQNHCRGPIPLQIHNTTTLEQLKTKLSTEFKIPSERQQWRSENFILNDEATILYNLGIDKPGIPLYVHLKNNGEISDEKTNVNNSRASSFENTSSNVDNFQPQIQNEERDLEDRIVQLQEFKYPQLNNKLNNLEHQHDNEEDEIDNVNEVNEHQDDDTQTTIPTGVDLENEPEAPLTPNPDEIDDHSTETVSATNLGWTCALCTLINESHVKFCAACGEQYANADTDERNVPDVDNSASTSQQKYNYAPWRVAKKDLIRINHNPGNKNKDEKKLYYQELIDLEKSDLITNKERFECSVCLLECEENEGVVLRDCLHTFCKDCLQQTVQFSTEAQVKCPFGNASYSCDSVLQEREIKTLVDADTYEKHLARSLSEAQNKIKNAFHCKTPNCSGWCIYEDNVNEFRCPVCRKTNCLTCQVIHGGLNCKQYQEMTKKESENNADTSKTRNMLEEMVEKGEAMVCPTCDIILMKKWGCDWLRCSMCKTEICWVTRGPRWGPAGKGDTSAGCRCGVNGVKCHPKCNYCH